MADIKVAPGTMVEVRLPRDAFPVYMAFNRGERQAAFIEHRAGRRGGVDTFAALPCPDLRPGAHTVQVYTGTEVIEARLNVV